MARVKRTVVALDVGATHVSAGLVSEDGVVRLAREIACHEPDNDAPLGRRIIALAGEVLGRARHGGAKPEGIAVGAPGIVDSKRGVLVVAGNLPELFGVPLGQELTEELGLPAMIENDVNARAVGEMMFGVAKGCKDFVLFSIGTDLGGGIVIDGKLHRGAHFIAAEFGHVLLDLDGPGCVCGGRGCAREYVSGAGIAEKAREKGIIGEEGTARDVFALSKEGDKSVPPTDAKELVTEFTRRFGAVIADVMKVLDPELVVLAGEIVRTEPALIAEIVTWVRRFYFPIPQLPDFRVSEITKETAVLGPAAVFFSERPGPTAPPSPARSKTKRSKPRVR